MIINEIECGKLYLCKKSVIMNNNPEYITYYKGGIYISEYDGCITNNQGDMTHMWNVGVANKYFEEIDKPHLNIKHPEKYDAVLDKFRQQEQLLINIFEEDNNYKWIINDIAVQDIYQSPSNANFTLMEAWYDAVKNAREIMKL